MGASPFLMVQILNPCPADLLLVIFITVSGLKFVFCHKTDFEESANLSLPQDFHNIYITEN